MSSRTLTAAARHCATACITMTLSLGAFSAIAQNDPAQGYP
jgi:hypothetical protein